jgi:hypothetical protein
MYPVKEDEYKKKPAAIQPQAVQQAWQAAQAPTGSMSADAFQKALIDKATAGVNSQYNNQLNNINQNLTDVLSGLNAEKGTAQVENDKLLKTIHDNEFSTSETQKELMNQYGWNPGNSGLAIGELDKVRIGADRQRGDAGTALEQALLDIARRGSDAQTKTANDKTALEQWKADKLQSAQADAMLQADARNYQRERDRIEDERWNKQYADSRSARRSGGGGGSKSSGKGSGDTQKKNDYTRMMDNFRILTNTGRGEEYLTKIKDNIINEFGTSVYNQMLKALNQTNQEELFHRYQRMNPDTYPVR